MGNPAELADRGATDDVPASMEGRGAAESPYPEEYVLLVGAQVVCHTPHQREAFARYAEAFRQHGSDALRLIPPRSRSRREAPIVIRGRGIRG